MFDESDPRNYSLDDLAQRCEQETRHYFKGQEPDSRYCFELFRRAIQEGDDSAWDNIYRGYSALVASWVKQHPGFESTGESIEYFVSGAFAKLSTALTKERFQGFADLRSVLRYFKMCVSSLIVDYLRMAHTIDIDPLEDVLDKPLTEASPEKQVMDRAVQQEFWEKVNQRLHDDRERAVIQGIFVFGLKPRELYDQMPTLFADVDEIYRIIQNVVARLRRDLNIRNFREQNS